MISHLLPGFRNIRTPLATGYLYLLLLWLWVGELIPTSETADGLIARAYQWAACSARPRFLPRSPSPRTCWAAS